MEPRTVMSGAPVVINEFVAANQGTLLDGDGESSDWIELYNSGAGVVDLSGWHLTDDPQTLVKWTIPAGTVLGGGEYLTIFASGKNRAVAGQPLHTNFQLDAAGEFLALVTSDLIVSHQYVSFPPQRPDVSYGLVHVGGVPDLDVPRYFTRATPGTANDAASGVFGFVAVPSLSREHGFYSSPFDLTISTATPESTVWYTLDGSVPAPTNPAAIPVLAGTSLRIESHSTLRAAAYRDGWASSPVTTRTYVFLRDVLGQSPNGQAPPGWPSGSVNSQVLNYGMDPEIINDPIWGPQLAAALTAIPSVSLVTDLDHLFDPATGIYVNASQHGDAWERPVSVEWIQPDGSTGFQIDAGLRIRGGFSRTGANPKHAFRLFFDEKYGADQLVYPLFGDEGVNRFKSLDLRTDQNDSWAYQFSREMTMIHDVFSRETQGAMGQPYTRSRYAHLYLNGQYWGLYQWQERPEADFGASYFGGDAEEYDVIKAAGPSGGYATEVTDGNFDAWRALWEGVRAGVADNAAYYKLQGLNPDGTRNSAYPVLLDVDNLIDYMTVIFVTGDEDAPLSMPFGNNRSNNWFALRRRTGDEGFKFFAHDAEQGLFSNHNISDLSTDRVGPFVHANQNNFTYSNPQWIHQDLMANAEYRLRFADRVQKHLFNGGVLTVDKMRERWYARAAEIQLAIIAESARWGDAARATPFTQADWQYAVDNNAQNYFAPRIPIVLDQLRSAKWPNPAAGNQLVPAALYPSTAAPLVSPFGGSISPTTPITLGLPPSEFYDDTVLVTFGAPSKSFVPVDNNLGISWTTTEFDDAAWIGGTTGVGYENAPGSATSYASLLGTNVYSQMFNRSNSVFTRTTFTLAGDEDFDRLLLRMKFDDGFVAYIDGVEVARSGNTPRGAPPWNETAGTRDDNVALKWETYDISSALATLGAGTHVLAIHGLNASTNNADMLILPELVGRKVTASPGAGTIWYTLDGSDPRGADGNPSVTAFSYAEPFALSSSATVKARTLAGGVWSALVESTYGVVAPVRITEIMYNPPPQSAQELARAGGVVYDHDEYEFIEIHNAGETAVPLAGLRFVDGVQMAFTGGTLAGGAYGVVVRNAAAFVNRYGSRVPILGEYGSTPEDYRLSNGGENVVLRDGAGLLLQQVAYDDDDPWNTAADGGGYSLTTVQPRGLDNPHDPAAWRASRERLGSPGYRDALLGDMNGDDRVGLIDLALLQWRLGTMSGATRNDGDLNGDGVVSRADMALLMANFGRTAAEPQPASAMAAAASLPPVAASRITPARRSASQEAKGLIELVGPKNALLTAKADRTVPRRRV